MLESIYFLRARLLTIGIKSTSQNKASYKGMFKLATLQYCAMYIV